MSTPPGKTTGFGAGIGAVLPMMAVLYGLCLCNIFLRNSIGVLAPELSAELGLAPALLGAIASAFFIAYAVLQIPVGLMLDRFGPRRTVAGMFLFTVLGTGLFAVAPSGPVMVVARLAMGIGCAAVFSGAFMAISRFYAAERFTGQAGTLNAFAMVGTFLATAPLALLVAFAGWRESFGAIAVAIAVLAAIAWFAIRDRPACSTPAPEAQEDLGAIFAGLGEVLRTPGIKIIASGGLALAAGNTILGIWGGPYLNDVHGLGEIARGQVLLFMAIAGVAGHFLYGQAARFFNTIKRMILAGLVVIALVTGTLAALPDPNLLTVTILLAVLGLACGYPSLLAAHARAMVPDRLVGRGLTTVNTGVMVAIAGMQFAVGAIIGAFPPTAAGSIAPETFRIAFGFLSVMAVITFALYLRSIDRKPRQTAIAPID